MTDRNLTLLTDLYQLTMMNGYLKEHRKDEVAVFDVFFRQNGMITYSVACGLEQVVDYILNLNFGEEEIISTPDSRVKVVVVPTDEELLIASDTLELVK